MSSEVTFMEVGPALSLKHALRRDPRQHAFGFVPDKEDRILNVAQWVDELNRWAKEQVQVRCLCGLVVRRAVCLSEATSHWVEEHVQARVLLRCTPAQRGVVGGASVARLVC